MSTLQELARLAETADAVVLHQVVQFRPAKDPAWLIGKGKAQEIAQLAEDEEVDLVIFDQELSPAQLRNLENLFPCKVIDRTQLILDIFAKRAQTKEGRIQVELAQLEYMLPRLAGRGKDLSRLGGGIGTRGPGEKKLETDRRHIYRQIRELKKELEEVKKHRRLHRVRRKKTGISQIALVGYTNAGKSTLFNRLTGSNVLAENQLFATLDPATRVITLPTGKTALLSDTVGFIQQLPHHLVAAFRSTLEQVNEADLLLHVIDSSHPESQQQMEVVEKVLEELGASHIPVLKVYNKQDLNQGIFHAYTDQEAIAISAFREEDLVRLKEKIDQLLQQNWIEATVKLPVERGDWIAELYNRGEVYSSKIEGMEMHLSFRMDKRNWHLLTDEIKKYIQEVDFTSTNSVEND